ncbi:MAG: aspartate--tRNA(Asn) ligase [Lachnospiraceae bacterium]|jgi:nondiscriminating aspartyl-tRNA synthetase|nr:aspartate--tRNA(Asn) ligase [Lachnospiraceae bacterium]
MQFLTAPIKKNVLEIDELVSGAYIGQAVQVNGTVHTIRDMGTITFIVLRKRSGLLQCVIDESTPGVVIEEGFREASCVEVTGQLITNEKAPGGIEIRLASYRILSVPTEPLPIPIAKWKMSAALETKLNLRPISLRNLRERAKFKIQEAVGRGFRDFLISQDFTEIHTPKIGSKGAEGGANMFKLDYFHKPAILAQSPQFYKQMMVGVFDRVYEVAPVFRAEKHNTKRHLNEYTSLDFEMGFIDSFVDVMAMETGALQAILRLLAQSYAKEINILGITLPSADQIPCVRFDEAKQQVSKKYDRPIRNPYDLEPEEEVLISQYYKEEYDADFVFVTHYPSKKRPVYAMDDPGDPTFTLSFDCLFRGMEITTGGQRIHDYQMLVDKIEARGMTTEGLEHYLMAFKHGMPPHGGLGLGLERLTMKLIGEDNVREATLFPRDLSRLEP